MEKQLKSGEVVRLLKISDATLRSWRRQGRDFGTVHGNERGDHTYSRRDLLSLAIMQKVKGAGTSLESAWQTAFWACEEVARWAEIWDLKGWTTGIDRGVRQSESVKARWALLPAKADQNPIVTDDVSLIFQMQDTDMSAITFVVVDLWAIARSLSPEVIAALR